MSNVDKLNGLISLIRALYFLRGVIPSGLYTSLVVKLRREALKYVLENFIDVFSALG